jgi:hypothetical protein
MTLIEIIHTVDPTVIERARRLEVAIQLLRQGKPRREVTALLKARFRVAQPTAWRIVDAASDMAA